MLLKFRDKKQPRELLAWSFVSAFDERGELSTRRLVKVLQLPVPPVEYVRDMQYPQLAQSYLKCALIAKDPVKEARTPKKFVIEALLLSEFSLKFEVCFDLYVLHDEGVLKDKSGQVCRWQSKHVYAPNTDQQTVVIRESFTVDLDLEDLAARDKLHLDSYCFLLILQEETGLDPPDDFGWTGHHFFSLDGDVLAGDFTSPVYLLPAPKQAPLPLDEAPKRTDFMTFHYAISLI